MKKNKKATIFVYVLILINVALIIWYVVFNNTYILNNNINIWKNAEEVFLKLSDKWNINIESVRQYNRNWWGFSDVISCPTNITMSWNTNMINGIVSEMHYDYWTVYCSFEYNSQLVRIYFNEDSQDFTKVYYNGELLTINNWTVASTSPINTTNWTVTAAWVTDTSNEQPEKSLDWNINTQFLSKRESGSSITYDLGSEKKLSSIVIYKKTNSNNNYRDEWDVILKNAWNTVLKTIGINLLRNVETKNVNLWYTSYSTADWIRYIQIRSKWWSKFMNISEIWVNQLNETSENMWSATNPFNDWDNTVFFFDSTWIWGNDLVDDNMNSDNYRATSSWTVWYPWDYIDDDVTPRLTIFWSVSPETTEYFNVFWNNYLTNQMINDNPYNNDLSVQLSKIWDVSRWYLFFDIFTKTDILDYDMKIIEFDRDSYANKFTLLPLNIWETKDLSQNYWYLQKTAGNALSLSRYKTWNEFEFNFRDKDYAIFFTNKWTETLAVRINWEERPNSWLITDYWKAIFINPIDESSESSIETIANHIIIGWEKNFIWENFKVVWPK